MNKKTLRILILLGVLALLCVGYAIVAVINNVQDAETEEIETNQSNQIVVMNVDEASVYYFSYTHDNDGDGVAEELKFTVASDNLTWHWHDKPNLKLTEGIIASFAAALGEMTSTQIIRNVTAEQLKEFGFETPTKYITVCDNINGEQTLTFGTYNSYNSCYYVYVNDKSDTVYLVSSDIFNTYETAVERFVALDALPEIAEDGLLTLTYNDGEHKVECKFVQPENDASSGTWFRSVDGGEFTQIPSAVANMLTKLMTGMEYLACSTVYADKLPEFGFEKTDDGIVGKAEMTVTYRTKTRVLDEETNEVVIVWNEHSFKLRLGDVDDTYGYYYVNPEGTDIAVMLGGAAYHKVFTMTDSQLAAEK